MQHTYRKMQLAFKVAAAAFLIVIPSTIVQAQQTPQGDSQVYVGDRGVLIIDSAKNMFHVPLDAQIVGLDTSPVSTQVSVNEQRAVITRNGEATFSGRLMECDGIESTLPNFQAAAENQQQLSVPNTGSITVNNTNGSVSLKAENEHRVDVTCQGEIDLFAPNSDTPRASGKPSGKGENVLLSSPQSQGQSRPVVARANPRAQTSARPQTGARQPNEVNPDGLEFFDNPDGTFYVFDPITGEVFFGNQDGNIALVAFNTDGSETRFEEDGSITVVNPNGETVNIDTDENGNIILSDEDDNDLIFTPDGFVFITDPENPDAFVEVLDVAPDGTVLFEDENGRIVERSPEGVETILEMPEGSFEELGDEYPAYYGDFYGDEYDDYYADDTDYGEYPAYYGDFYGDEYDDYYADDSYYAEYDYDADYYGDFYGDEDDYSSDDYDDGSDD